MTDRHGRDWLTPSLLRGAIFALAGLTVLLWPSASLKVLVYVGGAMLVASGASGLWGQLRAREDLQVVLRSLLGLGTGAGLLAAPIHTVRVVWMILAAYVALSGILALQRSIRAQREGLAHGLHLARAALMLALAVLLLTLPRAMFDLAFASMAVAAVLAGMAMVSWSLNHGTEKPTVAQRGLASEVIWEWFAARDVGPTRRREIVAGLYFESPDARGKIASYSVMLLLSVALASLAILQDSTAVIIGAMLVAPLMTPIMGCSAAMVAGWRRKVLETLGLIAVSVVASVGLAWILATWIPALVPAESNTQILSRAAPTLVDMAIALAAGAAGAYATVDDRVSSSLPGVAIAVALVPPLGVVGVELEAGHLLQALGAFLLFSTNLVSIILASAVVFVLVGLSPVRHETGWRPNNLDVLVSVVFVALLIMVPLGITGARVLQDSERMETATNLVEEWLRADSTLRLLRLETRPGLVEVELAGSGDVPSVAILEEALSQRAGRTVQVQVELFQSRIIRSADQEPREADGDSAATP